jgi:hypothetical protein
MTIFYCCIVTMTFILYWLDGAKIKNSSRKIFLQVPSLFIFKPNFLAHLFVSLLFTPNFADQLLLFKDCDSDFQDDDVTTFRRCSAKVQAFDRFLLLRVKITKLA